MCHSLQTQLVDHKQFNNKDNLNQKDSKDSTIKQSLIEYNKRSNLKTVKAVEVLPW